MKITIILVKDSPEVENWIVSLLRKSGIAWHSAEGFSVKDNGVTGIFERRRINLPIIELQKEMLLEQIDEALNGDLDYWNPIIILAESLGVHLYLVIWYDNREATLIIHIVKKENGLKIKGATIFKSCKELADWLFNFKGIKVSKKFVEPGRLAIIDTCLRKHGVPWPGNLDGFLLDDKGKKINAIFEFARTKKARVKDHDLNNYFDKDYNRWKPLDILRTELNASFYIIQWSSDEDIVKFNKVKNIIYEGPERGLIYESSTLIKSDGIPKKILSL